MTNGLKERAEMAKMVITEMLAIAGTLELMAKAKNNSVEVARQREAIQSYRNAEGVIDLILNGHIRDLNEWREDCIEDYNELRKELQTLLGGGR